MLLKNYLLTLAWLKDHTLKQFLVNRKFALWNSYFQFLIVAAAGFCKALSYFTGR